MMLGMYLAIFGLLVLGAVLLLDRAFDWHERKNMEEKKPKILGK